MSGPRYHATKVAEVPRGVDRRQGNRTPKVQNLIRKVLADSQPGDTILIATYDTPRGATEAKYRLRRNWQSGTEDLDNQAVLSARRFFNADGVEFSRLYVTVR